MRCHLSSPLTDAHVVWLPQIWDPVATASLENPRHGARAAGPLSHPAPFLTQSRELRTPRRVAASRLCLRYLRDRFRRMPTAEPGCARMCHPADHEIWVSCGFGGEFCRAAFNRLLSTAAFHSAPTTTHASPNATPHHSPFHFILPLPASWPT